MLYSKQFPWCDNYATHLNICLWNMPASGELLLPTNALDRLLASNFCDLRVHTNRLKIITSGKWLLYPEMLTMYCTNAQRQNFHTVTFWPRLTSEKLATTMNTLNLTPTTTSSPTVKSPFPHTLLLDSTPLLSCIQQSNQLKESLDTTSFYLPLKPAFLNHNNITGALLLRTRNTLLVPVIDSMLILPL